MERVIIKFRDAELSYGRKIVFEDLSMDIKAGDFLGVVGPNGSGKTTVLRAIMGLISPRRGKVWRAGTLRFGYCAQRQNIDSIFPFTVFEIAMMGRTSLLSPFKRPGEEDIFKVRCALEDVGITELSDKKFSSLSGGQKQRALLARALSFEPDFLVLDEPTADLDIKAEKEVLLLIEDLHRKKGITVAIVTHELQEVVNCAHKYLFLDGTGAWHFHDKSDLSAELLSSVFGTNIRIRKEEGSILILP